MAADSSDTGKLKICISESEKRIYLDDVIPFYEKENPEVEIEWEFVSLGENREEQIEERDRIASELMAGDGADLYFNVESFLGDPYKAQEAGCFTDLIPLQKEYTQFRENDLRLHHTIQRGIFLTQLFSHHTARILGTSATCRYLLILLISRS